MQHVSRKINLSNIKVRENLFSGRETDNMKLIGIILYLFVAKRPKKKRKGYGLDGRVVGVRVPVSTSSRPVLGLTQPHTQWVTGVLSPGLKGPGSEADHSRPTSDEVRNVWICTFTPHTSSWRSAYLVKHRDNFTFT
jgi:hypothetical protein